MTAPKLVRLPATPKLVADYLARHAPGAKAPSYRTIARWVQEGRLTKYTNGSGEIFVELGELLDDIQPDIAEGVREVCRGALRRGTTLTYGSTTIPRIITARVGQKYMRIPTENATIAHLDDMIALRKEQLRQDREALTRLLAFADKVKAEPGGNDPKSVIGDLIINSVEDEAAS